MLRSPFLLALFALTAVPSAEAQSVYTYTFQGQVDFVLPPFPGESPDTGIWTNPSFGDPFTIVYRVSSAGTSSGPNEFEYDILSADVTINGLTSTAPLGINSLFVRDDPDQAANCLDGLRFRASSADYSSDLRVRTFGPPCTIFTSTDLPTVIDVPAFGQDFASIGDIEISLFSCTVEIGPLNNDCANAIALPSGYADTAFDATGATTDGTDATGLGLVDYGEFGDEQNHNDIWFTYTPSVTGCTYISTLGLVTWDTRLTVYEGTGCPDEPLDIIAAADDEVRVPALAAPFEAGLDVDLVAGQTYTIRLGTYDAGTLPGAGSLRIAAGPGADVNSGGMNPSAPGCTFGDDCSSAFPIAGVGTFNFDLTTATLDGAVDSLCGCQSNDASADVDTWFLWTPPADDLYTVSTVGLVGGLDSVVGVHESCGQASVACNDDFSGGLESETRFRGLASETYLIRIASGVGASLGMGQFSITAGAALPTVQSAGFFDDKEYFLLTASTWPDAQLAAEDLGGSLVTIDYQAEQDFIVNTFQVPNLEIWIGLNDRETEGTFQWAEGNVAAYRSFQSGEPNGMAAGGEDYVHLASFFGGNWNDRRGCRIQNGLVEIPRPYYIESCFGDGGDQMGCTDCPCGNNAPIGSRGGCLNSAGQSARLLVSGEPFVLSDTMRFEMEGGTSSSFAILSSGAAIAPANAANPCFGLNTGIQSPTFDGLRCAVQAIQRHGARATSSTGTVGMTTPGWGPPNGPPGGLIAQGGFMDGQTRHYQVVYREEGTLGCGTGLNTTQVISVTFESGLKKW